MKVPKELLDEWETEWWETVEPGGECDGYEFFANKAAEWAYKRGADDELDACCRWLDNDIGEPYPTDLRNARRSQAKITVTVNGIQYQLSDEQQKQLNQIINSNA